MRIQRFETEKKKFSIWIEMNFGSINDISKEGNVSIKQDIERDKPFKN